MSQKKVDYYKEQKVNRKTILKKEKRVLMIEKIIGYVVLAAVVVFLGVSLFNKMTEKGEETVEIKRTAFDFNALTDYISGLEEEETEDAVTEETADTEEADAAEETAETEETAEAGEPAEAEEEEPAADTASETGEEAEEAASGTEDQKNE